MNAWLWGAVVLVLLGFAPCVAVACRGLPTQRVVGMTLAAPQLVAVLLLLAQGFHRTSYVDLGLVLAIAGPMGTLVFVRFVGAEEQVGDGGGTEQGP